MAFRAPLLSTGFATGSLVLLLTCASFGMPPFAHEFRAVRCDAHRVRRPSNMDGVSERPHKLLAKQAAFSVGNSALFCLSLNVLVGKEALKKKMLNYEFMDSPTK